MAGLALLKRYGLKVSAQHLGGTGARTVLLDVSTGDVWMRHTPTENDSAQQRGAA
jgi:chemotaxis protein CheD